MPTYGRRWIRRTTGCCPTNKSIAPQSITKVVRSEFLVDASDRTRGWAKGPNDCRHRLMGWLNYDRLHVEIPGRKIRAKPAASTKTTVKSFTDA